MMRSCAVLVSSCIAVAASANCWVKYTPSCCSVAVGSQPNLGRICGEGPCPDVITAGNGAIADVATSSSGYSGFVGLPLPNNFIVCKWNIYYCDDYGLCWPSGATGSSNCYQFAGVNPGCHKK